MRTIYAQANRISLLLLLAIAPAAFADAPCYADYSDTTAAVRKNRASW